MPEFLPFNSVSAHPDATSYVSVEWADSYVSVMPQGSAAWTALDDSGKQNALIRATMAIERLAYMSMGEKFLGVQRLSFPTDLEDPLYGSFSGADITTDGVSGTTEIVFEELQDRSYARAGLIVGGSLQIINNQNSEEYGEFYHIIEFDYKTGTVTVDGLVIDDDLVVDHADGVQFQARLNPPVPQDIKMAVVETVAYQLSTAGQQAMQIVEGVVEQALGSARIRFSEASAAGAAAVSRSVPQIAREILEKYERHSEPLVPNTLFI